MGRKVTGQIHGTYFDKQIFSVQVKDRLEYFYLSPRFLKRFYKYLYHGSFVSFIIDDNYRFYKRKKIFRVEYFIKIEGKGYRKKVKYYSLNDKRNKIKNMMDDNNNLLFVDLEMTMNRDSNLPNEIIQYGFLLVSEDGKIINKNKNYVLPTKTNKLSTLTKNFLNIDDNIFDNAISYQDFYDELKIIMDEYDPYVICWGENDRLSLDCSYKINKVRPLIHNDKIVNLQHIHKEYYNLVNDVGLFKTYNYYTGIDIEQVHDALEDAEITKNIYYLFKSNMKNEVIDFYELEKINFNY